MIRELRAEPDVSRVAVLGACFPLRLAGGGSEREDHPAFVRAASAVRRWGRRVVVIQDDVNALALGSGALAQPLVPWLLPRGSDGRRQFDEGLGNKHLKLDLEAAAVLPDGRLLLFGSGSSPLREKLVVLELDGSSSVREGSELYAQLRAESAFAGSELNIEGAVVSGAALRLFQRGNGRGSDALRAVNAVGDLALSDFLLWLEGRASAPALTRILRVDLGHERGVPLGFTDATLLGDGDVAFLACAERSPDVTRDGEVLACRLGILSEGSVKLMDIIDAEGAGCTLKLEGIEVHPGDEQSFDVVADVDSHDRPALGASLQVRARTGG